MADTEHYFKVLNTLRLNYLLISVSKVCKETDKEFVHIKLYSMEYLKEQEHGGHEDRKVKWCTF